MSDFPSYPRVVMKSMQRNTLVFALAMPATPIATDAAKDEHSAP